MNGFEVIEEIFPLLIPTKAPTLVVAMRSSLNPFPELDITHVKSPLRKLVA